MDEKEFLARYKASDFDLLSVAVDVAVFGIEVEPPEDPVRQLDVPRLKILLVRRAGHPFKGAWSLPGGFLGLRETLEGTAARVVASKTGLRDLYMEQLYTFGDPGRDPRARILSCAYLALLDLSGLVAGRGPAGGENAWFSLSLDPKGPALSLEGGGELFAIPLRKAERTLGRIKVPALALRDPSPLAFDHAGIILSALTRLRDKADYTDLVFSLMPEEFTLSQLMTAYEIILGEKLLSAAFRRKIAPKIRPTGRMLRSKKFRPSQLFAYRGGLLG
jgi:ADP-ribose pyrophosphatase YjhB (NUDIX family)